MLDIVDLFISSNYFCQAEYLLSVGSFNLDKERTAATKNDELIKQIDQLQCNIYHKYAWYGYLLLNGSLMYQEIKEKEACGVPAADDEIRKLKIQMHCVRMDRLVGKGFAPFENQMPHVYVDDPEERKEVLETTKAWIRQGHRLAETQADRTKFICVMEDVLNIERKIKSSSVSAASPSTSSDSCERIIRFK